MRVCSILITLLLVASDGCNTQEPHDPAFPPTAPPESAAWGPKSPEGLQMGCWIIADQYVIQCAIRNQSEHPISYSDYFLGERGHVEIRLSPRGKESWQAGFGSSGSALSAGAFESNIHVLLPGKFMRPKNCKTAGDPQQIHAFSLYLKDIQWPMVGDDFQTVLTQSLGDDGSEGTWRGRVESGTILLKRNAGKSKD